MRAKQHVHEAQSNQTLSFITHDIHTETLRERTKKTRKKKQAERVEHKRYKDRIEGTAHMIVETSGGNQIGKKRKMREDGMLE